MGGRIFYRELLFFLLKDYTDSLSQYNFIKKLLESSKGLETLVSQN